MKYKFIAIITIIFLATAQQVVAQKPVQITDSLGNVWEGKQNTNNEWDGSVKVTLKKGGVLTLSFHKGVRNPDAKFDNNEFNITGKLNDQFQFHDPKAKYILKKNPNITYSVEFNNGNLIKINSMEQTQMGIKLIADFDENFNIIDGKAEYKYTNASYAYIEVSGQLKNGLPEGEFTAYKYGKIVGNGTYSNGKLINGTEVLGTNDKNVMFRTRKITDQMIATLNKSANNNWKNQSDNNSQNKTYPAIYTQMHNSNIERAKNQKNKIVYQGLHLMKGNKGISLGNIPDTKGKRYIISIYAKGNFKSSKYTAITSSCGGFVTPGVAQIQGGNLAQEGYFKGGGASSCTIYLSGFGNANETFSINNDDFYVSVVIMEEDDK